MLTQRLGFLGSGQMARALATGFVRSGLVAGPQIAAADISTAAAEALVAQIPGAQMRTDNRQLVESSDIVFLAVKPQHVGTVAKEVSDVADSKLFVSIAAGVSLHQLTGELRSERVVRVMPNTPCLVGQGASAFSCSEAVLPAEADAVEQLLGAVGRVVRVEEKLLDAVTGLSGSGPAFVYQFIEALADGGVQAGLPRHIAQELAAQTVLGAAAMVLQTGEHPAVLKDRVASPAGTTIAGLLALESGQLRGTTMAAVIAATNRSKELGQQ